MKGKKSGVIDNNTGAPRRGLLLCGENSCPRFTVVVVAVVVVVVVAAAAVLIVVLIQGLIASLQ